MVIHHNSFHSTLGLIFCVSSIHMNSLCLCVLHLSMAFSFSSSKTLRKTKAILGWVLSGLAYSSSNTSTAESKSPLKRVSGEDWWAGGKERVSSVTVGTTADNFYMFILQTENRRNKPYLQFNVNALSLWCGLGFPFYPCNIKGRLLHALEPRAQWM